MQPAGRRKIGSFFVVSAIGLGLLVVSLLVGCDRAEVGSSSPEEIVRQRAQARWDSLVAGQWETAYAFASPAYRALVDTAGFRARSGGQASWLGATVGDVNCLDEVCEATVRLKFRSPLPMTGSEMETDYTEKWILADGEWWIFLKP